MKTQFDPVGGNEKAVEHRLYDFRQLVPTTGNIYFVDSVNGSATATGLSPEDALTTIDAAIGKCTAGNADVIIVLPGHVEDLGSGETIDADVAGITIVGLGNGPSRPRIDYNHATASFDIGASGVTLKNLTFRPSVATVAIGVDVEAGVTDTLIQDCEFLPGEAGDGTDEFAIGIDIKAGCTRTTIERLVYAHHASCDGAASCIKLTGASDRVRISDCWLQISGTAAVACIHGITTLSTRLLIENCVLVTDAEPGIELLTGTTGVIRNVDIFADLATIAAATVADGMAHFRVRYVEAGNESDAVVKTASADD